MSPSNDGVKMAAGCSPFAPLLFRIVEDCLSAAESGLARCRKRLRPKPRRRSTRHSLFVISPWGNILCSGVAAPERGADSGTNVPHVDVPAAVDPFHSILTAYFTRFCVTVPRRRRLPGVYRLRMKTACAAGVIGIHLARPCPPHSRIRKKKIQPFG